MNDWKNIFLQGLVGLGLVGYNTVKTLIDAVDAKSIQDYGEFFPNLALIDDGVIENQCSRVYMKMGSPQFLVLTGPQPRTDELSSMFLKKLIADIEDWNNGTSIDIYMGFGAFVTSMIGSGDVEIDPNLPNEEIADKLLDYEIKKERNIFVATSGNLTYDNFMKEIANKKNIVKEDQGYISGLNGVLPALVGERLNIPTVTLMIETTGTESSSRASSTPALAQFLGLLATKRALQFLDEVFELNQNLASRIENLMEELKSAAKEELINTLISNGNEEDKKDKESDFRDKMYV